MANRLIERLRGLWRLWGKELERKRSRMSPQDFGDMHESALIFVPAATFGQLIPKCDTAPEALHRLQLDDVGIPRAGKARRLGVTDGKERSWW